MVFALHHFEKPTHNIKPVRHIPKGARIQVALALLQLLKDCVQEDCSVSPWQKLFTFASSALSIPLPTLSQQTLSAHQL